ncbi:MAG: alpha-mannosidase [Clostridia bacterium]|nr:alpha-mannosidase [Clostridia bacterium]
MKKIHLIGNAHLDPVWLWRWQEGFAEIKATFRSALDRMNEFDHYIFTSACAAYYMWVEKSDPTMFCEIRQRVKEGRWCIVGGWFIQPDCNIPQGESFARHALISQRYFKKKFGITAKTGYNVDSFGHNGNLPKILRQSGIENYVFMRPGNHEKELAQSLFIWESSDGSRVRAYRIPFFYNIAMSNKQLLAEVEKLPDATDMMAFYGVGNHGGGPTIELLEWIEENLGENYVYSSPDTYFDSVGEDLPVVRDDLQYHAKGCYSACSQIKLDNRRSENGLLSTEKFSVLSKALVSTPYPHAELRRAWENVLFNQFHDIICGCSIKEAYTDAAYSHGEALAIAQRNTNFALRQISWNIDTVGDAVIKMTKRGVDWVDANGTGTPLVIFNPLSHEVRAPVEFSFKPTKIRDLDGKEVPFQPVRASKTNERDKYHTLINATVPAFGYTVYKLYREVPSPAVCAATSACIDSPIENSRLRLRFDTSTGELASIYDKAANRELLTDACSTLLIDETSCDTWAHGVTEFRDTADICSEGTVKLIENGPVRTTVRCVQKLADSIITRDYSLVADSDVITVRTTVDFREKHRMLKFSLPVNVMVPQVLCEIPYGFIRRPNDGTEQVCGSWFLMRDDAHGLCVANDSKHSFDAMGNTLSLTVLRSPIYADHYAGDNRDEFCEYMEQGIHSFEYTLFPYKTVADTVKRAAELNCKLEHVIETFHKGTLPCRFTGITLSAGNVIATAVKAHEDTGGTVIRLLETEERDTDVHVSLLGHEFDVHMPHGAVKTLIVTEIGVKDTDFLEF